MSTGIAIMTSGGDSAGMNPAVKCAVEYATQKGHRPVFISDGLRGLIASGYGHPPIRAVAGVRYKRDPALIRLTGRFAR